MTPVAFTHCPIQRPGLQNRRTLLATGLSALAALPARAEPSFKASLAQAYGGDFDPLKAHRLALAETGRLTRRADLLLRRQGLAAGPVSQRLKALFADERWLYPDSEAGRNQAVADMNRAITDLRPALANAIGGLPIDGAQAHRMSPQDEAAGKGGYRTPPKANEPGAYFVDLKAVRTRPAWTLPSAAFHEVIPGHLLQMAVQPGGSDLPAGGSPGAFFEAWAIYAEQLAAELGAYRTDPLGELGYLHWRLFRIGRVVADTGLHALGWSVDQGVQAMTSLQGQSVAFITIEADVARIARTPGKYAAEGLGAMTLGALRPRNRAAWPDYHRLVLTGAPWSFGDLTARVRG